MGRRGIVKESKVSNRRGNADIDENDSLAVTVVDSKCVYGTMAEIMAKRQENVLRMNVANVSDKSNKVRISAMNNIVELLSKSIVSDLESVRETLCDALEKNLRRTDDDAELACAIIGLLAIQNGGNVEDDLRNPLKTLVSLAKDYTKPETLRATAAQSLGISVIFSSNEDSEINGYLETLAGIWWSVETTANTSILFKAALEAWTMLLPKVDDSVFDAVMEEFQPLLVGYLSAPNVDIRIAAGEAIVTLYQLGCERHEEFEFDNQDEVEETIERLADEYDNHRSKRDKRAQKATFRQISETLLEGTFREFKIQFDETDPLEVDDWMGRLLYNNLVVSLKSHVNIHLSQNAVVRTAFDLGDVVDIKAKKQQAKRDEMSEKLKKLSKEDKW